MRHHPLADLVNAFIAAGLAIEHMAELGDRPVPAVLAVRARKPAPAVRSTTVLTWIYRAVGAGIPPGGDVPRRPGTQPGSCGSRPP